MDRLSIILTLMTGSVLTGAGIITLFSLGFYTWTAVLIAAGLGFILAWPAGYWVSRRIKRQDGGFDHTKVEDTGQIPDPSAREV